VNHENTKFEDDVSSGFIASINYIDMGAYPVSPVTTEVVLSCSGLPLDPLDIDEALWVNNSDSPRWEEYFEEMGIHSPAFNPWLIFQEPLHSE
jgi:hypothetical protein